MFSAKQVSRLFGRILALRLGLFRGRFGFAIWRRFDLGFRGLFRCAPGGRSSRFGLLAGLFLLATAGTDTNQRGDGDSDKSLHGCFS